MALFSILHRLVVFCKDSSDREVLLLLFFIYPVQAFSFCILENAKFQKISTDFQRRFLLLELLVHVELDVLLGDKFLPMLELFILLLTLPWSKYVLKSSSKSVLSPGNRGELRYILKIVLSK